MDHATPSALERLSFDFSGTSVRVILREGEPWWVAADVCAVLEIGNPSQALSYLDDDEYSLVAATLISNEGIRNPDINVVSEPGLYSLILRSRKPQAREFRRWITHEVLPQIRKTGRYAAPASRRELALAVLAAEDERDAALAAQSAAQRELEAAEPLARKYAAYLDAHGLMSVGTAAKVLGVGPNRLFDFMRRHRILISTAGDRFNTPYQNHVEAGRFTVKAGTRPAGRDTDETVATYTTMVTPKGLDYLARLWRREDAA